MSNVNFTKTELEQIQGLIKNNIRNGEYSGRKDYYDKRNQSILQKIETAIIGVSPYGINRGDEDDY